MKLKYPALFLGVVLMSVASPVFAQQSKKIVLDFEKGINDFTGDIEQDTTVAKTGTNSAKMVAELAEKAQSPWTMASRSLDLPGQIASVSFWVKSREATFITVRLVDSTGQAHQIRPPLVPGDDWQEVRIDTFESGPHHQSFEGANDQQVHWPAKTLMFIIEKGALPDGNGTIWIDDIEIVPADS